MNIKGLEFAQICLASPEQYDEEVIYYSNLGNEMLGCFENEEQREYYLNEAANKILI